MTEATEKRDQQIQSQVDRALVIANKSFGKMKNIYGSRESQDILLGFTILGTILLVAFQDGPFQDGPLGDDSSEEPSNDDPGTCNSQSCSS